MLQPITIEDLYRIKMLSRPRISPDGERIAFVVTTIDRRTYEYRSALWMVASNGGEARCLTPSLGKASDPSWSPDGRWLAFLSERQGEVVGDKAEKHGQGKPQIWLLPMDGGEAHQLTSLEHGAGSPVWSPDGKYVVFSAGVGPAEEKTDDGKVLPKARVIDHFWYRLDGAGFIYERRHHLFLQDVKGGQPQQLTDGDWDDSDPTWAPDGSHRIAFVSSRAEDRWRMPTPDLYTLTLENGKAGALRCLTDGSLGCSSPAWSPDGQTLAFLASSKYRSSGHVDLYTIAAEAQTSTARCLTSTCEATFMDWTNSDIGDDHLQPQPRWSADGKTIYALASHRGASRMFAVPCDGGNTPPPTLTPGDIHVRDVTTDASCNKLALLIGSPTRPQEIFVRSTSLSGEMQRLTHFNDALFDTLAVAQLEYMPYVGAEEWPMDGWILKPLDFDPAKKYPLVLEIHGGPATQYGYGFFHEMQLLAGAGYVVLFTNPRGSCGYGRDFSLAVRGAWGEKDSLDILAGVETLLHKGYIDEKRIGVTGGSYGGFMTNWLVGHTDLFKTAITDRCVTNLVSDFGSSDFGWSFADDELETTPWDDVERYRHMSPITYVNNIHTPLLILHSEQDLRCNIEQAEQLFTALKYLGRDVLFVRFEGQSHGLSRGGHPKLRVERLQWILNWFEKYLKQEV